MESLIWSYKPHLLTVGIIHALLIGIVCHVHRAYGSSPWFMPEKLCRRLVYLLPICGIFGSVTVLAGVMIIQKSPMTFILFNAALITVMFLELSIVLGRNYSAISSMTTCPSALPCWCRSFLGSMAAISR